MDVDKLKTFGGYDHFEIAIDGWSGKVFGELRKPKDKALDSIKQIKAILSSTHLNDMPVNKIQLRDPSAGTFLKDAVSLAALNLGPTATVEMVPRSRGGKKK